MAKFNAARYSNAASALAHGSAAGVRLVQEAEHSAMDLGARQKVYLHPGRLFAAIQPSVITTVLGSCVSVCLWDPLLKIGGMNHYLLPFCVGDDMASPRFGTVAIEALIEKVLALGARHNRLCGKLFGGACVIEAFREREDHIGIVNARLAENMLRRRGIPVVEQDLTGRRGRKLSFNTDDGASSVKYL
jgi:chemotaxis protein CheD